jgi:uncharacterized membrane protein YphA (DoxX/SURF4 family)
MIQPLAVVVTCLEIVLGLLLLAGLQTRITGLASGILLAAFGMAMALALALRNESTSRFLGLFGCRGKFAPGGLSGVSV